jgi:hypothetical protein
MVNTCEPVIKVVTENEPKRLTGLGQKAIRGGNAGLKVRHRGPVVRSHTLPADSGHLTRRTRIADRSNPVSLPSGQANRKGSC